VRSIFDRPGPLPYATVVVIPQGEGLRAIADRLEREGIIYDQRIFIAAADLYFGAGHRLKAGEYAIEKGASMRKVLDTLIEGKAIVHSITVPEGLTSQQVVERLNAHPDLTGEITQIPPEGSLLPDTYAFALGTNRQDLVARMQAEQEKFLDKLWATRAAGLPLKSKREAVILASIVEKETGRADERPRVAAVFLNRLRKNMRLESDPTIIYGLAGGKGTLGRPILRSEMEQPTPYNTYRIRGLPPTPIANPGKAAIEAVLRPSKTDDVFFVADGSGGHVFAATFEQHQANVAKWRVIERELRARAEAAKAEAEQLAAQAEPGAEGIPGLTVTAGSAPATQAELAADSVPLPERNPRR
jgi:UPF0755 protein